jgi:RNA polymerase sigma-70 factor (ECF subfamily)
MPGPTAGAECAPDIVVTTASDEQLFQIFIEAGDHAAFTELHRRYEPLLIEFVLKRYLPDRNSAEDAVQTAFLNAHSKADQFDITLRFRPWLFTLAANVAINMKISMGRRQAVSIDGMLGGADAKAGYDPIDYRYDQSDDAAATNERADRIRAAIDNLREGDREAIQKVYYDGMTYKVAAQQMGVPLSALKNRIHRALKQLRRKLGDEKPISAVA